MKHKKIIELLVVVAAAAYFYWLTVSVIVPWFQIRALQAKITTLEAEHNQLVADARQQYMDGIEAGYNKWARSTNTHYYIKGYIDGKLLRLKEGAAKNEPVQPGESI